MCKAAWSKGLIVTWSVKLDVSSVMSGAWQPYLEQLASWIGSSGYNEEFIFVIWHEPENDFKPDDYVAYFNKVHDTLKAINPGLITCHAALGYRYDKIIKDDEAPKWRTKADINAIDIYSGRSFPLTAILPELNGFNKWFKHVVGDSQWAMRERGFIANNGMDEANRAFTMKREADWLATQVAGKRLVWAVLWDTDGTEHDPGLLLDDPQAIEAARYYMQRLTEPVQQPEPAPETGPDDEAPMNLSCPLCHGTGEVSTAQTYVIVTTSGVSP